MITPNSKNWPVYLFIVLNSIAALIISFGTYFDFSTHVSYSRVSNLLFPIEHIYINLGILIHLISTSILAIFALKRQQKDQILKKLTIFLIVSWIIELTALGIDRLWHLLLGMDKFASPPHLLILLLYLFPLIIHCLILNHLSKGQYNKFWVQFAYLFMLSQIFRAIIFVYADYEFIPTMFLYNPINYILALVIIPVVIAYSARKYSILKFPATITLFLFIITRVSVSLIIYSIGFKYPPLIPSYLFLLPVIGIIFDLSINKSKIS